jgi:hypothetical protein
MKILLASMTAACALAVATPAAAQFVNSNAGGTVAFENRIAQIESRIQAGIRSGAIDRTEAANLRMELRSLRQTYRVYARNGLTQTERSALQARVRDLRQDLRLADGGAYGRQNVYAGQRYDRNGNPDNDGMYDRYGNRIDVGVYAGTRYDIRGRVDPNGMYDRDGNRIDVYGQGGPYEPVEQYCEPSRSGIGGIFDDIFGRDDDDCVSGLTVGARASGNLYAVPSQYRYRYRDGNGVFYRTDGRQIYQIDARTNTVLRIYPIDR